jgi:hypothetical protein
MHFNLLARVLIGVLLSLPLPLLAQEPLPKANEHRVALVIGNSITPTRHSRTPSTTRVRCATS